ncbi:hypothetical protein ACSLUB_11445 [Bordetella hinzii]|uniref:hypothetical protein n=1 Tax=Bordetella hinzii TaxID=103855 RepID=UPI0012D2EB7F|nr:hypothetical protein [Bordetella hinzii]
MAIHRDFNVVSEWDSGFKAGVEAMRERAANTCEKHALSYSGACNTTPDLAAINCATLIRHYLPGPGEKFGPIGPIGESSEAHAGGDPRKEAFSPEKASHA